MILPEAVQTFKPKIILPKGFVLIVDTREQAPLFDVCEWCVRKALKQGDYSVVGFEDKVAIERKNMADLLSSLGSDRKRFEKELERLEGYEWKGLVIEGTETEIYVPSRFSSIHPNSVYQSICSMEVRGFHVYYAKDREKARWWVLSRLAKYYKHKREK
ncbi:MAG TPA: ERCC4 domain-containing protein [Mesotoga sp.]|nr:ERCC4 domain-containing protein [Mesotoga sp.]HRU78399.1 ERCC4 domain-containing protein [Rectinema sp.]